MIVTYVPDPLKADGRPVIGEVITAGTTVVEFSGVQPVFVTGGTVQSTIIFSGSINTDIGSVKIEDADENYAVIPQAGVTKTNETKALVVQHIDHNGNPLSQTTQVDILNAQGTLATSALQVASSAILVSILNSQGTQATSALQAAGNATLSALLSAQGTQSTSGLATVALQSTGNSTLSVISNNQGTGATSALQTSGNSTLTAILKDHLNPGFRDAFGRERTSTPHTLFDSKLMLDAAPQFWDDAQTSGTGTSSTYNKVDAKIRLAVSASTAGARQRQTFRRFNYQPGKSQQILMTFVFGAAATGITRRAGYFSDHNGLYLEQTSTGPSFVIRKNGIATETYAQTDWNSDKLDGTGASGVTLDLTKAQIMWIDFEWLGVGIVRFGFVVAGTFICAHVAAHSNSTFTDVYMSAPNLPLRYEIANSGAGGAATMDCICSSVVTEGGVEHAGIPRAVDRGIVPLTTLNDLNLYPVLGLRLSAAGTNVSIQPTNATMVCTTTSILRFAAILNPRIPGSGTLPWKGIDNSGAEFCNVTTGTNVVWANTGTLLSSGYADSSTGGFVLDLPNYFSLGVAINGNRDEIWLCGTRLNGSTEAIYASLDFNEQ